MSTMEGTTKEITRLRFLIISDSKAIFVVITSYSRSNLHRSEIIGPVYIGSAISASKLSSREVIIGLPRANLSIALHNTFFTYRASYLRTDYYTFKLPGRIVPKVVKS